MKANSPIPFFDLRRQYRHLKNEIDEALQGVLQHGAFVRGPEVDLFADELCAYLQGEKVVPCGNGTDALQIALMTLDLKPGDEVIVPSFTYPATAEVVALLGLSPRFVDSDENTFCLSAKRVAPYITKRTKAIIPVHLYGQPAPMEEILQLAEAYNLYVVEDNAQAMGATYTFSNGETRKTGTIGDIGCTSFFPSKNLGAYGDGGALTFGKNEDLAQKAKKIANHGQKEKYRHECIGCNSRLDSLQAAVLRVKLRYLDKFNARRREIAALYDRELSSLEGSIQIPFRPSYSSHVFYQYTLRVYAGKRDALKAYLSEKGISTGIYYPRSVLQQSAYKVWRDQCVDVPISERLPEEILSLPMFPELEDQEVERVTTAIIDFFKR